MTAIFNAIIQLENHLVRDLILNFGIHFKHWWYVAYIWYAIHMIIFLKNLNIWNNFWHLLIGEESITGQFLKGCKATCMKVDKFQMCCLELKKSRYIYIILKKPQNPMHCSTNTCIGTTKSKFRTMVIGETGQGVGRTQLWKDIRVFNITFMFYALS